jgi:hypothetical protein
MRFVKMKDEPAQKLAVVVLALTPTERRPIEWSRLTTAYNMPLSAQG